MTRSKTNPVTADEFLDLVNACGLSRGDRVGLAVSGGGDSLALLHLASQCLDVTAFTVNHGLRPEASRECEFVGEICKSIGVSHTILVWHPPKDLAGNIQAKARQARYDLLETACREYGLKYLLLAHHLCDQAETFLLRLMRGSGLSGLAAMRQIQHIAGCPIVLVRPFLQIHKNRLLATVSDRGFDWVDDPSNYDEKYDRVKVRRFLEGDTLTEILPGLDAERIASTASDLRRAQNAIDHFVALKARKAVTLMDQGWIKLDRRMFFDKNPPPEILYRLLAAIFQSVAGAQYPPRFVKIEKILAVLKEITPRISTLGGVQFGPLDADTFFFCREVSQMVRQPFKSGTYDHKYKIETDGNRAGFVIGPVGEEGWKQLKADLQKDGDLAKLPYAVRVALPAIWKGDTMVCVPLVGFLKSGWTKFDVSVLTEWENTVLGQMIKQ